MKRLFPFVLFLAVLASLSGYMLSKASLLGRVGIHLFYKQYSFLKVWWQAGMLVFAFFMLLFFVQWLIYDRANKAIARGTQITAIVLAVAGLIFTYNDFRDDITHRWMGERFHIGAYSFWMGWLAISIFILLKKKKGNVITSNRTDALIP